MNSILYCMRYSSYKLPLFVCFVICFSELICHAQHQSSIRETDLIHEKILGVLYEGQFIDSLSAQKWKAPKKTMIYTDELSFAYTIIDTMLFFHEDNAEKCLVITKTLQLNEFGFFDQCVGCPPCIGMAIFSKNENNWELESFHPMMTVFGQGGAIPTPRIIEVGLNHHVVALKGEISWDEGIEKWYELDSYFDLILEYKYVCRNSNIDSGLINQQINVLKTDKEYYDFELVKSNSEIEDNVLQDQTQSKETIFICYEGTNDLFLALKKDCSFHKKRK